SNLLCACTFVTPMVLAIAIPVVSSKISFNVRYVVMALPPLLVLLAVVVLDARPRRVLAICVATLTVATALSLVNWYTDDRYAKEDLSAAGPYLATHVVGGDRVYVSSWTVAESLDTFGFHAPVTKVYAGTLPATVDEIRRNLPSTTSAIWLVEARTWESDKDGALRAVLDANARLDVEATWPGLDIRRYTVR
ncbi:MAG TPA: hypothetical protein VGQ20_15885, partial [Acidimicrobiales bacterium]|nr:hypothetical protein [Acidimicrobiales bacterium]